MANETAFDTRQEVDFVVTTNEWRHQDDHVAERTNPDSAIDRPATDVAADLL